MKYLALALLLFPLNAFATEITDLYVDESAQTLNIIGHFGDQQGTVTVDSVILPILFWSDTMITCHIDSDGRGSCGPVTVQSVSGEAARTLLWYGLKIVYTAYQYDGGWVKRFQRDTCVWHLVFRVANKGTFDCSHASSCYINILHGGENTAEHHGYRFTSEGNGPLAWLDPDDTSKAGFKARAVVDSNRIAVTLGEIFLRQYLATFIDSGFGEAGQDDYRSPNFGTQIIKSDPVQGIIPQTQILYHDTNADVRIAWSLDTIKRFNTQHASIRRTSDEHPCNIRSGSSKIVIRSTDCFYVTVFDIKGRPIAAHAGQPGTDRIIVLKGFYFVRIESAGATKVVPVVVW